MADDGEVKIKTTIDNSELDKGLKSAQSKVKGAEKQMNSGAKSTQKFGGALKDAAVQSNGLASKLSAAAKTGGVYAAAIAAAIGVAKKYIEGIRETSEAFKVQQKAELELAAAAKNNPYLSEQSVKRLKEYAGELQKVSNIGDETAIKVEAQLAATGRTEEEIIKIMGAAADYAAATGQDIASAAQTLNATYSGMAGTLGRQIGAVKELTAEQLKNGEAIDIVAKAYKGMAEATQDARIQAQNAKGDFAEALGAITKPTADAWDNFWKGFYEKGIGVIGKINEAFDYARKNWIIGGDYRWAKDYVNEIKENLKSVDDSMKWKYTSDSVTQLSNENLDILIHYINLQKKRSDLEKEILRYAQQRKRNDEDVAYQKELEAKAIERVNAKTKEQLEIRKKELEDLRQASGGLVDVLSIEYAEVTRKLKEIDRKEKEAIQQRTLDVQKKANDYAAESNKALKAKLEAMELEAEITGKSVDAQEVYNVYLQSYIDLLTKTENTITKGMPVEQKRLEQLEAAKKAAEEAATAEEKLAKATEYTNQVTALIKDAQKATTPAGQLKEQLAEMQKAKEAIQAMSDEEVKNAQKDSGTNYSKEELLKGIADAEKQITENKVNELVRIEKSGFDKIKEENEKLREMKQALNESEVLSAEEKAEKIREIENSIARNNIDTFAGIMEQVDNYAHQVTSTMQQAADIMLQTVKYQTDAELATLEKKYLQGELSEEEYQEEKIKAKKKAAKEEYKIQLFQWSASILTATADIAAGAAKSLSLGFPVGIIAMALTLAAGAVQIASLIAAKPTPPSFAGGGIVQGNSYTGDKVRANVNSGEMILNATQQKALWEVANGKGTQNGGFNLNITNNASNAVTATPRIDRDKVELLIDMRVNDSLKNGRYDRSLEAAEAGMSGSFYGI